MNRFLITILLLLCTASVLMAQVDGKEQENESEKCDAVVGWYVEAAGGVQMLFSRDADRLSFTDRWTPAVGLSVGKWVTPAWGFRLSAKGYSLNGYSTARGLYLADPLDGLNIFGNNDPVRDGALIHPDGSYRHFLRYLNVGLDFRLNLVSLLRGSEELSRWDVVPSAGFGYMHVFSYKGIPNNNMLSANFSLGVTYRVCKAIDINLEAFTSVVPDQFDGRIAGRTFENNLGVTLGVAYKFKPRKFKPRSKCDSHSLREVIRTVRDTVVVERVKEVEVPAVEPAVPVVLATITFPADSHGISTNQEVQLANVANYLNAHPGTKVLVSGYADRNTGTADYNQALSCRRAESVARRLVADYGIDASSFKVEAVGDAIQPYASYRHNRIVIVKTIVDEAQN